MDLNALNKDILCNNVESAIKIIEEIGRDIISINTDSPWGVESIDGQINFDILPEQLQEWND